MKVNIGHHYFNLQIPDPICILIAVELFKRRNQNEDQNAMSEMSLECGVCSWHNELPAVLFRHSSSVAHEQSVDDRIVDPLLSQRNFFDSPLSLSVVV